MNHSPWTLDVESSSVGQQDSVTLVDGSNFMLCARSGDVVSGRVHGVFMLDTRVVSRWELTVNGVAVEALAVLPEGPFRVDFVGRFDPDDRADAAIVVMQRRYLGGGLREELEVRNHGTDAHELDIVLTVDGDFRNVFDVKAGRLGPVGAHDIHALDDGVDVVRSATVDSPVDRLSVRGFPGPDETRADGTLTWRITVEPQSTWHACVEVTVTAGEVEIEPSSRCGTDMARAIPVTRLRDWRDTTARIVTGHAALRSCVDRSLDDLGALRIFDPDHVDRMVVAAGAPWFMTLFGRDSLLTSWMTLPVDHALAHGVLAELADTQGRRHDDTTEEDPGRILHEVRFDRLSARLLGGEGRYYGSVDATPLFVMLAAELTRWVGVSEETAALLPSVDRALAWMQRTGDLDGDGFVEYLRRVPSGLEHQGWKDSWDGIRHADGSVATPPIALAEVQAYRYAALLGRAALARAHGEHADLAASYEAEAAVLRERFDEVFWNDDDGWYAVGLDAHKQQIRSLASNIGHLLWTGIVPSRRAPALAELLVGDALFSGWGVRTLASTANGYNPLSYHCGSVWPHDTAIALAGLARYRFDAESHQLIRGLLDVSVRTGGRLPELFGGFDRSDIGAPVPYPASCSPQAWAAAAPLLMVRSMLGIEPDAANNRLRLRPRVPAEFGRLGLLDLPIGDALITIEAEGHEAAVQVLRGDLDITVS